MTHRPVSIPIIAALALVLCAPVAAANLLANPGFEGAPASLQLPPGPGVWSGDILSRVSAQDGVTPAEGSSMVRFDATFWSCPSGGTGSDLWQLVPVSPSAAVAHLSARFNRVAGDGQTDTRFRLGVRAFPGSPSTFDDAAPAVPAALAARDSVLDSDGNPQTWQTVAIDLAIPPGTGYLAVLLSAEENVFNDNACPVGEFDGHYADEVILTVDAAAPAWPPAGVAMLLAAMAAGVGWTARRNSSRQAGR